jgi:hypothetical protein
MHERPKIQHLAGQDREFASMKTCAFKKELEANKGDSEDSGMHSDNMDEFKE